MSDVEELSVFQPYCVGHLKAQGAVVIDRHLIIDVLKAVVSSPTPSANTHPFSSEKGFLLFRIDFSACDH